MRKIYPLFFLLFSVITYCRAQDPTPNPGFENWTETTANNESFYVPNSWNNLDPETAFGGVLTCLQTSDSHSGSYAVKLVTSLVFGDTANGLITTGQINVTAQTITGGIPYTQRPDSMYGWYKYSPTKGDSTDIEFGLYDNNGNTIGLASFTVGNTVSSYTRFSAPIIYYSSATPDTSRWLISSSNGYKSYVGSTLYIDDIGLVNGGAGINNPSKNPVSISIIPNPTSGFIVISNPKLLQGFISLFNDAGVEVKQFQLSSEQQNFDVHDLANGNYLYSINDKNGERITNGSIILK